MCVGDKVGRRQGVYGQDGQGTRCVGTRCVGDKVCRDKMCRGQGV